MSTRADRYAFVYENGDDDEGSRQSGLFSAHWQERSTRAHGEAPETDMELDEALAWARGQATSVQVQIDGVIFSAGEDDETSEGDDDVFPWPQDGLVVRPRPMYTPFDGSVQRRYWGFRSGIEAAGASEELAGTLQEALSRQPGARHVSATLRTARERSWIEIDVEVCASSVSSAMRELIWMLEEAVVRYAPDGSAMDGRTHGELPRLAPGDPI